MKRLRVTFVGFETFWMRVQVEELSKRYAAELDCRWLLWPSTWPERLRFIRAVLSSDLVIRLGMPFEFQSETNRLFLVLLRLLPGVQGANYWIGSDVASFEGRRARAELTAADLAAVGRLHHFAGTKYLGERLRRVGVPAVDAELIDPVRAIPAEAPPLPPAFRVLAYWSDAGFSTCGGAEVLAAARRLPDVPFDVVGTRGDSSPEAPPNVTFHGFVDDIVPFIERAVVYVRIVPTDALPSSLVQESMLMGRHVVYAHEWPCTVLVPPDDVDALVDALEDLRARHAAGTLGLNTAGREMARELVDQDRQAAQVRDAIVSAWRHPL